MTIRIAEHKDITDISSVLAASWKSAYRGIINDDYLDLLEHDHWIDFLLTGLSNETIFAMVLEDNQHIIGAAILGRKETSTVHLISLYLMPDKIGQGFGHAFYDGIEAELRHRNFTKCFLDVLENNERAIRFYETHGFMETIEIIKATLGDCEYPCKVYEKWLG